VYVLCVIDGMKDYCQFETFNPQCWQTEVVVIEKAFYGRRHAGRCTAGEGEEFSLNPRYFGCSADVTAIFHARCSGRKQCEVRIPDPELDKTTACVVGLRMFLEASYYCAEGNNISLLYYCCLILDTRRYRLAANHRADKRCPFISPLMSRTLPFYPLIHTLSPYLNSVFLQI